MLTIAGPVRVYIISMEQISQDDIDFYYNTLFTEFRCGEEIEPGLFEIEQGCSWLVEDPAGNRNLVSGDFRVTAAEGTTKADVEKFFFSLAVAETASLEEGETPHLLYPVAYSGDYTFSAADLSGKRSSGRLVGLCWALDEDKQYSLVA